MGLYCPAQRSSCFCRSQILAVGVKVGSKPNIPGSKIGCHLTALLASTLVCVRCKTKQNSIWSMALNNAFDHVELCLVLQTEVTFK